MTQPTASPLLPVITAAAGSLALQLAVAIEDAQQRALWAGGPTAVVLLQL